MFRKFIITLICSLSIFVLCSVPSFASTMTEEQMAIEQIRLCWQTSTSKKNVVSFDSLTSLCADLNRGGYPCEIRFVSALNGYAILGTGYVHNTYESSRVYSLSGKYYSNIEGSIFYTPYQSDSLLSGISTYVSTISSQLSTVTDRLSSLINNVSIIHSDLQSIDNLLTGCAQSLSNLNNYFTGEFQDFFFDVNNNVASSNSFLGEISTKMDSVVNSLTTENGKNSLFYPITQRLSTIIDRIVPAYSHPFANRGWFLSSNDLSSLSVSDVGYTALSSMMETVTEEYLSYPFFAGAYHIDVLDSLSIVHSSVGGNTGYFIRGIGRLSKSVNGINEFYEDQTFYLGESNNTLFYASDTSFVSLDTSGLENTLSNINDNIIRLFGEYDSTYEFPLIPTSFSGDVVVSGAKSSLFASVSDSLDLYYSKASKLRFDTYTRAPSGDSPLGSSYTTKPYLINSFTYFEDLSSNPVPSGTVLHRNFGVRYYDSFTYSFSNVPLTVSVSGDSCYIDCTIAPKWDSSGSWLGWYVNDSFVIPSAPGSGREPFKPLLSSPPGSGIYYIYSISSSPVPVVYSTRFTSFLQSQVVLLQNSLGSIGGSDLSGVISRLDSILGKLDSSSGSNLTTLESTVANIESTLSIINDKLDNTATSIENTTVNISNNNPAYNVFYVTDENGEEHSITSVAADSLSASGKLLQFLYKLVVDGSLSGVDSAVDGLNDFFFDSSPGSIVEGGSVWD